MNRKFFTWVAGTLLLAASLSTANAQTAEGDPVGMIPTYPNSDGKLYQLSTTYGTETYVLTMNGDGILDLDTVGLTGKPYSATYGESLWCINFGQNTSDPQIDFTNKAHSLGLAISSDDAVKLGNRGPATSVTLADYKINVKLGNRAGWKFSETYQTFVQENKPLYTSFIGDSVLVLGLKEQDLEGGKKKARLVVVKAVRIEVTNLAANGITADGETIFIPRFTLWTPADIILKAADFNTLLSTKTAGATKLAFDKNNAGDAPARNALNPWTNSLIAVDSKYRNDEGAYSDGGEGYLNFALPLSNGKPDTSKYVRVDTSYVNMGDGQKYMAFNYGSLGTYRTGTLTSDQDRWTQSIIRGQYDFEAKYSVSDDSVTLTVKEYLTAPATSGEKYWSDAPVANKVTNNIVYLKVFTSATRLVTVGDATKTGIKIKLSLSCGDAVGSDLTSVDNDVYVITSGDQVYGIPIYGGGAQWITFNKENVDPNYIPAYQWIVKKIRTDAGSAATSPLSLTNREHPTIALGVPSSLQLSSNGTVTLGTKKINKDWFKAVPAAQKGDPYLGYYHITLDESRYNTYALNYLHPFSSIHYLGQSASDTTLIVKDSQTQFKLNPLTTTKNADGETIPETTADESYGYNLKDITGLVELKRTTFKGLHSGSKAVSVNDQKRYVVHPADTVPFLLKTNNTKVNSKGELVQYYTLLAQGTGLKGGKLGVSDDNAWAYQATVSDPTTSAFAVSEFSAPMYRKFDGGTYTFGQESVNEPFGQPDNSPLWLTFSTLYSRGYELLFENQSPDNAYRQGLNNKSISFLGVRNKAEVSPTDPKYTFYVDTAFVTRPATTSSSVSPPPTPKPQYMLALNPQVEKQGWRYKKSGETSWTDEEEEPGLDDITRDSVLVPGLTKASYLFNAQDSVNVGNADYVGKAAYAPGETRLAFVDGVHRLDTFYVLPPSLKGYTARQLQIDSTKLYSLPAVNKHFLGLNTHFEYRYKPAGNVYPKYYFDGSEDGTELVNNGKSMVFQFRLTSATDPDRPFLIESTSENNTIAPTSGTYVQIRNNVPIVATTSPTATAAAVFYVLGGEEGGATGNEKVAATSKVRVIAGAGSVNILNATGKKVTVTNILGQNLATQVLNSNNARISLPQGIVVVAVEGEPAVKAIVSR